MRHWFNIKYLVFGLPFSLLFTYLSFLFLVGAYPIFRKRDIVILALLLFLYTWIFSKVIEVVVGWIRQSQSGKIILVCSLSLLSTVFIGFYAPISHPKALVIHPFILFLFLFTYILFVFILSLEADTPIKIYLMGGVIFVSVFLFLGFTKYGMDNYFARDDGLITLSHGKNLADYGFIGINPSGERVEGYSAPVQFFIYYFLYLVTRIGFFGYNVLQNLVFSFLLGVVFMQFIGFKKGQSLLYGLAAALILTAQASFIGWHASGMENPITHVLFAATCVFLFQSLVNEKILPIWQVFIVFLASISRLESIYHIGALLLVYLIIWFLQNKNWKPIKGIITILLLDGLFHLWRYFYFGDLLSNTAYAQEISILENIKLILTSREHLLTIYGYSLEIIKSNALVMLIALAGILLVRTQTEKQRKSDWATLVFWVPVLTGLIYPFLFGKTRIDIPRTTTFMTPLIVFLLMYYLVEMLQPFNHRVAVKVLIFSFFVSIISLGIKPYYYLGWNYKIMDETRQMLLGYAEENSISRATIANPDIGIISWYKNFNVLDLGWLGNSVLIKIEREDEIDYILNKMAPDMIELKANWSLRYNNLTQSAQFADQYLQVEDFGPYRKNPRAPQGIWIRKDILEGSGTPERELLDKMSQNPDISIIESELALAKSNHLTDLSYISRSAYHFLPELVEKGQYEDLRKLFDDSSFSVFDRYLIESRENGQAYQDVIDTYQQ